jgi:hypothetical protein
MNRMRRKRRRKKKKERKIKKRMLISMINSGKILERILNLE